MLLKLYRHFACDLRIYMCSWNLEIMLFFFSFFSHIFSFNFFPAILWKWTRGRYLVSATSATVFFFFCKFYRLSNGSLVICHWAFWCPGHQHLQCFDCNNKFVLSLSLKVFYSFTYITLPLLHIFGEHSSVSPMLLFGGHKFSEFACFLWN